MIFIKAKLACDTIHCYVKKEDDLGFGKLSLFWQSFSTLDYCSEVPEWVSDCKIAYGNCLLVRKVSRLVFAFLFLNMLVFLSEGADGFVHLWKIFKWIYRLPPVSVSIGFFKCQNNFCLSILGKMEKEERKAKETKKQRANAIFGWSSWLFQELSELLAEAEWKGVFDNQEEKKEEWKLEVEPYTYCGHNGHEKSMC